MDKVEVGFSFNYPSLILGVLSVGRLQLFRAQKVLVAMLCAIQKMDLGILGFGSLCFGSFFPDERILSLGFQIPGSTNSNMGIWGDL